MDTAGKECEVSASEAAARLEESSKQYVSRVDRGRDYFLPTVRGHG